MNSRLKGANILVTRPKQQAEQLAKLIEQHQGQAILFPTLEIIENAIPDVAKQAALQADWLIFTSKNAVDFACKAFNGTIPHLDHPRIAAIGESTANALRRAGWRVDCVPKTEFNSEALLAEPALQNIAKLSVIIVRGVGGREKLANSLRSREAKVSYLEVYQRLRPQSDSSELSTCLQNDSLSAITITSVEALENLLAMLNPELITLLKLSALVVVSDRIKHTAEQLGFKRIVVSKQPTDAAILETLKTLLNGENRGRNN